MLTAESDINLRSLGPQRGLSGVSHHTRSLRDFATWGLMTVTIKELSKGDVERCITDCEPPKYNTKQKAKRFFPILPVAGDR